MESLIFEKSILKSPSRKFSVRRGQKESDSICLLPADFSLKGKTLSWPSPYAVFLPNDLKEFSPQQEQFQD